MKQAILRSTITEIQSNTYLPSLNPVIPEHNIHPAHTAGNIGLCDAINQLIREIMKNHPIKIIFKFFEINEFELPNKIKGNIFSLVNKHLDSIINHQKVLEINIALSHNKNRLLLSIADNGVRFDASTRTYSNVIDVKNLPGIQSGNLNLISNPYIGNCLIYHQNFN